MLPSELAIEARDELQAGWVKHRYSTATGEVCAYQALERCVLRHMAFVQGGIVQSALNTKAHEIYGVHSIQTANDLDDTVQQDMVDMYDKAIGYLQEKGQ